MNSKLDSLASSYTRLSRDVAGRIEFAFDLDSDDALRLAEQEKEHLDQAFFVLSFSALEKNITALASARLSTGMQRAGLRSAPFDKRLETALKVAREVLRDEPEWASRQKLPTILNWYEIRNEIAPAGYKSVLYSLCALVAVAAIWAVVIFLMSRKGPLQK